MTPEKLTELTVAATGGDEQARRRLARWANEMYGHPKISGMNGKTYRTRTRTTFNNGELTVKVYIDREKPDGTWETAVGTSERKVFIGANPPTIYNATMFLTQAQDKNAGIQTIYNQHAFMYAKAAGFKSVRVSAVQDGIFVWGKVGFRERLRDSQMFRMNNEVEKFRAGQSSLIKNDSDARIVESLIGNYVRDPDSVRHMDFVTAISNTETAQDAKKAREAEIKQWFIQNIPFSGGVFDLEENNIVSDPRDIVEA
jgi:hypothetical protein